MAVKTWTFVCIKYVWIKYYQSLSDKLLCNCLRHLPFLRKILPKHVYHPPTWHWTPDFYLKNKKINLFTKESIKSHDRKGRQIVRTTDIVQGCNYGGPDPCPFNSLTFKCPFRRKFDAFIDAANASTHDRVRNSCSDSWKYCLRES